ncbi:hypothetical protein EDF78_104298 [Rahnella sp. BIGb0236]|jgi:hypothetical protein|nr:hypothetical protein EDF78_104298 [Rahnella sp. BIGb0236]VTQ56752.1 Uncharacterised protein [Campylobacter jejuni]
MGSLFCLQTAIRRHCALMNASIAIFTEKRSCPCVFPVQNTRKKTALIVQKKHVSLWLSHFCFNKITHTSK